MSLMSMEKWSRPSQEPKTNGHNVPNPEVTEKPERRRFTAGYKARIVKEADACSEFGQVGALLRREGLYASQLAKWRRQVKEGTLSALGAHKRGPKAAPVDPNAKLLALQATEIRRLQRKLAKAEAIIDFQKKVHELLGIPLKTMTDEEIDS